MPNSLWGWSGGAHRRWIGSVTEKEGNGGRDREKVEKVGGRHIREHQSVSQT